MHVARGLRMWAVEWGHDQLVASRPVYRHPWDHDDLLRYWKNHLCGIDHLSTPGTDSRLAAFTMFDSRSGLDCWSCAEGIARCSLRSIARHIGCFDPSIHGLWA